MKGREPLFDGYWTTLSGERLERITREEMRDLHRIWRTHRDLRGATSRGERLPSKNSPDPGELLDEQFQIAIELDDARDERKAARA